MLLLWCWARDVASRTLDLAASESEMAIRCAAAAAAAVTQHTHTHTVRMIPSLSSSTTTTKHDVCAWSFGNVCESARLFALRRNSFAYCLSSIYILYVHVHTRARCQLRAVRDVVQVDCQLSATATRRPRARPRPTVRRLPNDVHHKPLPTPKSRVALSCQRKHTC